MKKLLSALLILLLALASAPALAQESFDPTGTWYFSAFELADRKLGVSYAGITATIEFFGDSTARLLWNGEPSDCKWTWDGDTLRVANNATMNEEFAFTLRDNALIADLGVPLVLEREPIAYDGYESGKQRTDASITDFDGAWQAVILDAGDILMPMPILDMVLRFEIENGSIRFTSEYEYEGDSDTIEGKAAMQDGALVMDTTSAKAGDEQAYLRLSITDKDVLVCQMSKAFDGFTYYAQRITQ